jgi:hypothetical protein
MNSVHAANKPKVEFDMPVTCSFYHCAMRFVLILSIFAFHFARAQSASSLSDIQQTLIGSWAGILEYRDYSEPTNSTKRVKLPTWLTVEAIGPKLRFGYVDDDGPSKTVRETETVAIDTAAAQYQISGDGNKTKETYSIAGLASLRQGRGTLTLSGSAIENGVAVNVRITVYIGRNILIITRETASRDQPFAFRHSYTMVRASAPEA